MDEYIKGPQDYVAILRRRRWHMLLPAAAVFGMAVLVAFVWPPTYRSSATVLIERPEVPPELVQSTVTSFADQRLQTINQRVMTTQNLINIINEWKEEGMEREVLVLPDGTISFPLAGHIQAAGKSAQQVEKILADRLRKFFKDAAISVSVKSVTGNKIFVIGQVQRPGEFLAAQPIDVIQALSLAGGFTPFAAEDEIRILRREGGKQTALTFDYSDVEKGRNLKSNILLKSGDVVIVPTEGIF